MRVTWAITSNKTKINPPLAWVEPLQYIMIPEHDIINQKNEENKVFQNTLAYF